MLTRHETCLLLVALIVWTGAARQLPPQSALGDAVRVILGALALSALWHWRHARRAR